MPPTDLIATLNDGPRDIGRFLVLLWTWLLPQIGDIDSGLVKLRDIRQAALDTPAEHPDLEAELERLRRSTDLPRAAAKLLALLERYIAVNGSADTAWAIPWPGIDGLPHLVAPWEPWIVRAYFHGDKRSRDAPPAIDYPPSMAQVAPSITVVPEVDQEGMRLQDVLVDADAGTEAARGIALARARFAEIARGGSGATEERHALRIHLATLGDNSLNGVQEHLERQVFSYGDPDDPEVCRAIEHQLRAAVSEAVAANATILVLPELAVPVGSLQMLRGLLLDAEPAPALTIAGMRHVPIHEGGSSPWANESVVLAEDGTPMFRHRKMTAFCEGGRQEDTRLGDALSILRTAIGNATVLTCLDSFGRAQRRLETSYASLVLVPSLSKTVSPHRTALPESVRGLWGSAFVCNRHPSKTGDDACTGSVQPFWTLAMLSEPHDARRANSSGTTFVFDLREDFHGAQQDSSSMGADAEKPDGA